MRGVTQNLDVVIYPTARIYRKFSSVTLIFSEKMYVVIWRAYFHSQKIYKSTYGHSMKICPFMVRGEYKTWTLWFIRRWEFTENLHLLPRNLRKNVRCIVRGKNRKIHRKFTSDTPYFFRKMSVYGERRWFPSKMIFANKIQIQIGASKMKEAKSPLITRLLLTIKNNFSEGYTCVKTSTMGKPVVGFSDSG